MPDTVSTIYCMVSLCISSGSWKRGDGLHLSPVCTSQHNNHLQVHPGHYLSKTGSICFWPIAWLVGCILDLILGCTRFLLQIDRVYPFWVIVLYNASADTCT